MRTLLGFVADAAIRGIVIAAVIGAAIQLLRGRDAALRLKAWTVVLWAALALPAIGLIVPVWQWPIPVVELQEAWVSGPAPEHMTVSTAAALTNGAPVSPTAAPARISGPMIAGAIYLAGVLGLLFRAGLAWITTRHLRLTAPPIVDATAVAAFDRHASAAGLSARPDFVESSHLFVPVTMSVVRPAVILPDDWREWPEERLDAVLIHELAHVARRDAFTQRLSLFYRAAFWFSPLSWWLHRHIANLAEQASDEAALRAGVAPTTYAETLLHYFARLQHQPRRAEWHLAMARHDDAEAERRVERILTWDGGRITARPAVWIIGIVLVAASAAGVTASVRVASVNTPAPALPALPATAVPNVAPIPEVPPPPVAAQAPPDKPAARATDRPASARPAVPQPSVVTQPAGPAPVPAQQQSVPVELQGADIGTGVYRPGGELGVSWPVDLTQVKPRYTPEGMRQKIQGVVDLEIVVLPDGTVGNVRLVKSLDQNLYGLDEQAVAAAKQWKFKPGLLNGKPVAVIVGMSLEFRLH